MNKLEQAIKSTTGETREILDAWVHSVAEMIKEKSILKRKIDYIAEDNRLLRKKLFGSSSEKLAIDKIATQDEFEIFNEFELVGQQFILEEIPPLELPVDAPVTPRKQPGRKALPAHLPRVVIEHDLSAEEKQCVCGNEMECISTQVSEELEYVSAKIEVIEHRCKKIRPYLLNTDDKKLVGADSVVEKSPGKPNYDPARLEFYIYDKMAKNIEYGRLYCNDSVSFADLDDDLVDDSLVDNVEAIARECGYPKLAIYCGQRLEDAVSELDKAWKQCNNNIASQKNTGLKIKTHKDGSTTWSLAYDADEKSEFDFFKGVEPYEIASVIKSMGDRLNIWTTFQHKLFRYLKQKNAEPILFTATALAEALGIGYHKMAEQSNVSLTALQATHDDYLYAENLMEGNAVLSDYIDQLPVSRTWDLYENKRVADGDGQKFVTKFHTLQSRFSAKYYRTRRGISIYSIVANHIPINAKVIGPHEHESHFLFDALYNNQTHIPIDFITGDNHSINQMNYVVTDVIDTCFIPNIKQIRESADKLYCVGDPKEYTGFIEPCGEIDLALIKSEKRGILRVLISLLLQENSQAVIMRKLSSHKRHSRLQRAFWEYNKIFKTTHTLNVINDSELRKVIKTARNRTESYHQLQRGLRKVGSGLFKGRRITDNQMSCQATRLVANFIIAYNATLLNGVYLRLMKKYGEAMAQTIMASISPVAWVHILFTGRYHFKKQAAEADFEALIARLEKNLQKHWRIN